MRRAEKLYEYTKNEIILSVIDPEEKRIIVDGFKRYMCVLKAFRINTPSEVPEICRNYSLT